MNELEFNKFRKSLIMSYRVCPRQAWYSVRDPEYEQYNEFNLSNPALLLGQIFHKEMDKFYTGIDVKLMSQNRLEDNEKYLFSRFSETKNEECLKYFKWYSNIEAKRFSDLLIDGKGEIEQRFIPMFIEKYVEFNDDGVIRNGHFDRMDYLGNKQIRLVEYKTGESYDVTKPHKLSKLRFELYWYKVIVDNLPEFKEYTVKDWMLINPTMEMVHVSTFHTLTGKTVEKTLKSMVEDVNKNEAPARKLNLYCTYCKFRDECLIDIPGSIFDISVDEKG